MSPLLQSGMFGQVGFQYLLPLSLGFEKEFDCIPEGAFAAGVWGRVVGLPFHLGAGVLGGDRQSSVAHCRQIDDVVTDKCGFVEPESGFLDDLPEGRSLVVDTLEDKFQFQVAGPESDGFREAFGDQAGTKATKPRERNGDSIVSMEALELDRTLCAKLCVLLRFVVLRQEIHFAVCEDSVNIEEQELDFTGTCLSGNFGHRWDSNKCMGIPPNWL